MLTDRFEAAFILASQLHASQTRTGTSVPYLSHLLGVASMVLEDGGDEDEAIAALLHDAVEDQGGRPTLELIQARFGARVAQIVEGCTDEVLEPGQSGTPWRARKERYLAHLSRADASVRRVSVADKLHNARAILRDYRRQGESLWARFSGGREGVRWYYRSLAELHRSTASPLAAELAEVDAKLEELVNAKETQAGN